MRKALLILLVAMTSCGVKTHPECTVEEEIIDLNWNSAVKDLDYLFWDDPAGIVQNRTNQK